MHELKTKGYDVIGVNIILRKLMRFRHIKGFILCALYYLNHQKIFWLLTLSLTENAIETFKF